MSDLLFPAAATDMIDSRIRIRESLVSVIASYSVWNGLQLHSLAVAAEYVCSACGRQRDSAMVATAGHALVCPGCFAYLSRGDPVIVEVPEQRTPHAS